MTRYFLISFFLIAVCAMPLHAAVPDGTRISSPTLAPLAQWVEKQMGVKIKNFPVVIASGIKLKTALGLEGVAQARSIAAYVPGRIYINNVVWDEGSVRVKSYLLHEMVHHAQILSGRSYPCQAAKEREAYELQNRWLTEQGDSAIHDADWIETISACG